MVRSLYLLELLTVLVDSGLNNWDKMYIPLLCVTLSRSSNRFQGVDILRRPW